MTHHKIASASRLLLFIVLLVINTQSLHTRNSPQLHAQAQNTTNLQFNYLVNLQNNYAAGVKALTTATQSTRTRLEQTSNLDDKIKILESAITDQKLKIFTFTNQLKPDQTLGYTQCVVLPSDKQKVLVDKSNQLESRIQELKGLIASVPDCDQVQAIKQQIRKMSVDLNLAQKTITNQCEQNLLKSSMIYQTNLYKNDKWLLGSMTMDQFIDEYYQRSVSYSNISNCPLNRPFLNSGSSVATSQSFCIKCPDSTPYFDMSAKKCVACPADQTVDINARKCGYPLMDSNFDAGKNYRLDPMNELPPRKYNMTCPAQKPYFNTSVCVTCTSPTNSVYWQVSQSKCNKCPQYSAFNITSRQCQKYPSIYVYGSDDRLLATQKVSTKDYNTTLKNAIKSNPQYFPDKCPDPKQYAAIKSCVQCDPDNGMYFNVQTLTCTHCDGVPDPITAQCSQRKYYLANTNVQNILIPPDTTIQAIRANYSSIVSSKPDTYGLCPLDNPFPYNNKTQCGKCVPQAPLFSIQLQGCTYCPQGSRYDPVSRQCRPVLYLTNYDQKVILPPKKTLDDLLKQQATLNQTKLTSKCPQDTPYTADNRNCQACFDTAPYFDLASGLCLGCTAPTTYSNSKKGCYNVSYLTNLAAPNILEADNYTIANVDAQQKKLRADSTQAYEDCPLNTPFGVQMLCANCTQANTYFNLKTSLCQKCPQNSVYQPDARKCAAKTYITNYDAGLPQMVATDAAALNNYKAEIDNLKKQPMTTICPPATPFAVNGACQACADPTAFFIIATRTCGACNNFNPTTNLCPQKQKRYANLNNFYWITNDGNADKIITAAQNQKSVANGPICPSFYNQKTQDCLNCPQTFYYNYDTGSCQTCPAGTVFDINIHACLTPSPVGTLFTNIQASPNDLQIYGGLTLDQIKQTQQALKSQYPNAQYCPANKPFYDNVQCISCPSYKKYFNLRYKLCQVCLFNQKLVGNDCINQQGNKVWQQPVGKNVYPFLFGNM